MFTKLAVPQRIQVGLFLALAFLLVLGSNRLDRRHFSNIQTSVNSVYKDRVVVQNLIYQLNNIFHQKKLQSIKREVISADPALNEKVDGLLSDFGTTELTKKEARLLANLNKQFENLKGLETDLRTTDGQLSDSMGNKMVETLDGMVKTLDGLAQIQLEESGEMTSLSNKSLGMNILLSKLEVGFLVLIGIALLLLIWYPIPKISTKERN